MGDVDRRRQADLVERAFTEGLLDVDDLERGLEQVLRARTRAELQEATAMLPAAWLRAVEDADVAARRSTARREALRREVRSYLGVLSLLVGIWLLISLSAGFHFFWPIWPALGWGLPLLGRHRRWQEDLSDGPPRGPSPWHGPTSVGRRPGPWAHGAP